MGLDVVRREISFGFAVFTALETPVTLTQLVPPLEVQPHVVLVPSCIRAQLALVLAIGVHARY